MNDRNKYNYMEKPFQTLNAKFITLKDDEIKRNNQILHNILSQITKKMVDCDPFFKKLYTCIFYGGSFYDGIRVGHAEEFDLDLLMHLPSSAGPTISVSNGNGFLHIQLTNLQKYLTLEEAKDCQKLSTFVDSKNYLNTDKVLNWFRGVVDRALNSFKCGNNYHILVNGAEYQIKKSGSGPAVTLKISGFGINMDIDLVPCFRFNTWPNGNYKKNPTESKSEFFVVPKKPKNSPNLEVAGRYWRLSFQEQERILMDNKGRLKPALRLLKKFRDEQKHVCIASYFIKTMFLWEIELQSNDFWNAPLPYIFITMLKKYCKYLEDKQIPYYWNKKLNLLEHANSVNFTNIANATRNIIQKIERSPNDPKVLLDYLLNEDERLSLLTL